jgi:predicted  nucleic acid-binding Zn-ribbon protein
VEADEPRIGSAVKQGEWKTVDMNAPEIAAELKRLRYDVAAHQRQIRKTTDLEMVRLLKAEESILFEEIARLRSELRTLRN